ncbi:MAG: hypothetical protein NTZ67_05585 [Gammaproteobacteria bacterium]|nr:hypothetical protein [Gammaproteobacteria bacterium]
MKTYILCALPVILLASSVTTIYADDYCPPVKNFVYQNGQYSAPGGWTSGEIKKQGNPTFSSAAIARYKLGEHAVACYYQNPKTSAIFTMSNPKCIHAKPGPAGKTNINWTKHSVQWLCTTVNADVKSCPFDIGS